MSNASAASPERSRSPFDAMYAAHVESIWRVARLLGVADAHLDDVVHDVFLVAHRRFEDVQVGRSPRAWLHGITRNIVKHYRRSHARAMRRLEVVRPPAAAPSPDEFVARQEAGDFMDRFLASLRPDHAEVFVLFEIEEMPAKEIAAALSCPTNTVFSRLRTARRRFNEAVATLEEDRDG